MRRISRRELLRAAALGGASLTAVYPFGRRIAAAEETAMPLGISFDACGVFKLGVASFDPTPTGVLLWTRVAPEPFLPDGHDGSLPDLVEVGWAVASDPGMRNIVQEGVAAAPAELHHTVRVDVDALEPATTYWYAFRLGDDFSTIGRTRTAPLPDDPRPVTLAWVGCSKFHVGYFTPYDHLVAEEGVDLVLCTGDYIYEEAFEESAASDFRVEDRASETLTLSDYRARYTLYRADPKKRRAHQLFPWIVTWDDHEVDNNYAGLVYEELNKHPELPLARRRADAYRAHFEYLPARAAAPSGPDYRIYRRTRYGQLDLLVTDSRQYRTDQPCGDELTRKENPLGLPGGNPTGLPLAYCAGFNDANATILGAGQREWLLDELSTSTANWRVLLNAVMVASLRLASIPDGAAELFAPVGDLLDVGDGAYINPDQWDGYATERRALLEHLHTNGITDTVVLTGDIHSNWVADLPVDADDPISPVVATEFVGTSITSDGFGAEEQLAFRQGLYPTHNHIRWLEGVQRGYSVATITADEWITRMVAVDTVKEPMSGASTIGSWRLRRGQAGADPIEVADANDYPRLRTAG